MASSSVSETLTQINAALRSSGRHYAEYSCKTVSWDDVQRGTVNGKLSCWGANITDTRLFAKDGRQLFTVRRENWNEKLGKVSAREIALVASGTEGGGGGTQDLTPISLREFLFNTRRYGAYAGLDTSNLADDVRDEQVSIRFQTTFLPVDSGNQSRLEFAPEAYNYNTTSDLNPRNLVLLCTTQGVAVQQDGAGSKKLFHHVKVQGKRNSDKYSVKRYWLEAESSNHKVGGSQMETLQERQDAIKRGKATASVIGIKAMGTRFNALMIIQIPLSQTPPSRPPPPLPSAICIPAIPEFKCLLVGDAGVGKTCLVKSLLTGEFVSKYQASTNGVEVTNLQFYTSRGPIKFQIWNVAGNPDNGKGFREGYYVQAKAVIIMFDVTSQTSYKNIASWYQEVMQVYGPTASKMPVVLCGNKADVTLDRKVKRNNITFHRQKKIRYYDMSVKNAYNVERVFLDLARQLAGDESLQFCNAPALQPPETHLDEATKAQLEADMMNAACCALPEDFDDDDLDDGAEEEEGAEDEEEEEAGLCDGCWSYPPLPSRNSAPLGTSSAARVSRGSLADSWTGLGITKPKRHASEHITVTIVMYHTCSGGVPTEMDVRAAVDDLEALYRATTLNGNLSNSTFQFMKSELTVKDMVDIHTKLAGQPPPKPCAPFNHNVFPQDDDDDEL